MSLSLVTAPAEEPISLQDATAHLRLEDDATDVALVNSLIKAARQEAENHTHRAFITQTWDLNFDTFPTVIKIPKSPLVSVTHVKFYDTAGAQQTLAASNYIVDAPAGPQCLEGRITLSATGAWPAIQVRTNAISVRFVAGYGVAFAVPEPIKSAMKLIIGHLYENRENVVITERGSIVQEMPQAAQWLLGPYTIVSF